MCTSLMHSQTWTCTVGASGKQLYVNPEAALRLTEIVTEPNVIVSMSGQHRRSRLFEFWTGNSRLPLGGVEAIEPKPRIQVMVSQERQHVEVSR